MDLGRRIAAQLADATYERIATLGLANAQANAPRIGRSILELTDQTIGAGDRALVIGAGPSLRRRKSLERVHDTGSDGVIVAVDGALGACLRAGLVPHVMVTADPHAERIIRWFGDPAMTAPPADDYVRRQEMDPVHHADELGANNDLVRLVDAHASRMALALARATAPVVAIRAEKAGMALYWWNPMYDDYEAPDSVSRRLHHANGLPCLNGGGNIGTAAWVLTHAVRARRDIALVGFDFGYAPGTPYEKTQYYPELREFLGDRFQEAFIYVDNAFTGERWFTDPPYYWFREVFLELVGQTEARMVNCTEGGILFGARLNSFGANPLSGGLSELFSLFAGRVGHVYWQEEFPAGDVVHCSTIFRVRK
jgi:hypothetical protein